MANSKLCFSSVTDLTSTVSLAQQERGRGDRRRVGEDVEQVGRDIAVFSGLGQNAQPEGLKDLRVCWVAVVGKRGCRRVRQLVTWSLPSGGREH